MGSRFFGRKICQSGLTAKFDGSIQQRQNFRLLTDKIPRHNETVRAHCTAAAYIPGSRGDKNAAVTK